MRSTAPRSTGMLTAIPSSGANAAGIGPAAHRYCPAAESRMTYQMNHLELCASPRSNYRPVHPAGKISSREALQASYLASPP
jgi:hypothetical protein